MKKNLAPPKTRRKFSPPLNCVENVLAPFLPRGVDDDQWSFTKNEKS